MPRVATPNHRAQRTFAPLVFRARFQPERLLTPPPLPWNISYPPHGEGKPADDTPLVTDESPSADKTPLIKIKRPPGEPGRKGERGFSTKDVLDLPEGVYEDLLVGQRYADFWPHLIHLIGRYPRPCCETFGSYQNHFKSATG
jgi:hypothetical protein